MSRNDDREVDAPRGDGSGAPSRNDDDPVDPLEVLGNEVRVRVLRALADADRPLAFSELRRRSDVRDTGRFNYHLDRLTDYFVDATDDGYVLAPEGSRVVDLADATGVDATARSGDGVVVDDHEGPCPVCGDEDCDRLYHVHLDPPGR
ncbi:winged helix-turn-helix domain-containing protein [Halorubellus salinus]|uniref:winged helix-turn-helix domain-containing protein n=1 Tax=Halorubellus salinus TaxID=755309 RepID=UPI001D094FAE|nr:helix-turn-helix domain-containing protein [Halorubellus salinus]